MQQRHHALASLMFHWIASAEWYPHVVIIYRSRQFSQSPHFHPPFEKSWRCVSGATSCHLTQVRRQWNDENIRNCIHNLVGRLCLLKKELPARVYQQKSKRTRNRKRHSVLPNPKKFRGCTRKRFSSMGVFKDVRYCACVSDRHHFMRIE
ncbi:hypothetical protein BDN72DRAFT_208928 [Pluteus cervinus]|uniref:Uncharacterized protein n=1 Tax=Pluteus cervinus TaxID=181527 RepID=A0ACD3AGY1_9AGAR|nr:hypothetical protein BDN72DRAFT_208928 [Pluteus cervinus]